MGFGAIGLLFLMMECWHQFRDTQGWVSFLWFVLMIASWGVAGFANKSVQKENS